MKDKVYEIVSKYTPKSDFRSSEPLEELGIDSMSTIDMILELEDIMNVAIPDNLLTEESFKSVDQITKTISMLL
ncbi:phosphopantetheine-binding protein [Vibrio splendidus]